MQTIELTPNHSMEIPDGAVLNPPAPEDNRQVCTIENGSILINGETAEPFNGIYFCNPGDNLQLTAEIHAEGELVEALTIPRAIKMPIVRHANGQPTDDEVYLDVSITAGVMTSTGTIPRSGDWKILIERNNAALQVIGANIKLVANDLTFLA